MGGNEQNLVVFIQGCLKYRCVGFIFYLLGLQKSFDVDFEKFFGDFDV